MRISFSSLFMSLLFGNTFIVLMALLLKRNKVISKFNINFIVTCLMLIIIRLALPIELYIAKTVPCQVILPDIRRFLSAPIGLTNHSLINVFLYVWWTMVIVKIIAFYTKHRKAQRLLERIDQYQEKNINDILDTVCREYACKNPFKVRKIDAYRSPFIVGLVHPTIVLTQSAFECKNLEFIIRHEAEHFFHKDLWIKYLVEVICIIYWWNPFVYILKKEFDSVLELRNDVCVTEKLNEDKKLEYLNCLLDIAKMNYRYEDKNLFLAFSRGAKIGNLEQRFDFILNKYATDRRHIYPIYLVASIMVMIMSFSFILEAYRIDVPVESSTFAITPENAYILEKDNQFYICVEGMAAVQVSELRNLYYELPLYREDEIPSLHIVQDDR